MQQEIRTIYPGEAVLIDDTRIIRAQTFGATGTINSEDINELGNFEIVEAVDNAPTVAIDLTQFDYASIDTEALLAGENPALTRYVGVTTFNKDVGVVIYAPVIKGEDYGKTNANAGQNDALATHLPIYRTMYIENAYVNSIDLTYNTDGNAEESFSIESDNKRWLFNDASSVVHGFATNTLSGAVVVDDADGVTGARKFVVAGADSAFTIDSGL